MGVAYVVDGLRTPFGRYRGGLASIRADDLVAHVLAALVERTKIDPAAVNDVIIGCANQAGEDNRNVARMGVLLSGMPTEVPGITVNRLCGSGMQAFADASRLIVCGEADLVIAGGVEQMSRSPFVVPKSDVRFARGHQTMYDTTLGWRLTNPKMEAQYGVLSMGQTAERVAKRYNIGRDAQDEFALASQQKAAAAASEGRFDDEIIEIDANAPESGASTVISQDEHPRPNVTAAKLASLKPAFASDGTVTAGNCSGLNDGAVAMLMASERAIKSHNLVPMARYVSSATAGVEPSFMGIGPIPAAERALRQAGLNAQNIALAEINEAFAAQAIPCIQHIGLNPDNVNVNGGAIALGHPLGASGTRLVTTLTHELHRRKQRFGLAAMCVGVGQGIAVVIESCR